MPSNVSTIMISSRCNCLQTHVPTIIVHSAIADTTFASAKRFSACSLQSNAQAMFSATPDRLICAAAAGDAMTAAGTLSLVAGRGTPGSGELNDTACSEAVGTLEASHAQLFASTMNGAYEATTEGAKVEAYGSALYQRIIAPHAFTALLLPLRQYKPMRQATWSVQARLLAAGNQTPLYTCIFNVSSAAWVALPLPTALSAGSYRLELWPSDPGSGGRAQSLFTSPAWVSNVAQPAPRAAATGGSITFAPGSRRIGDDMLGSLGQRLVAAMKWQLIFAGRPQENSGDSNASLGVFTIPDANWRGVGTDSVGASSAFWDLIRSGWVTTLPLSALRPFPIPLPPLTIAYLFPHRSDQLSLAGEASCLSVFCWPVAIFLISSLYTPSDFSQLNFVCLSYRTRTYALEVLPAPTHSQTHTTSA